MKFKCLASQLGYALDKCSRMAKFKDAYPQARNIILVADEEQGVIRISATDAISSAVTYTVRDSVEITQGGEVVVDAKSLAVFTSSVYDDLDVYITRAGRVMFKCGSKKISLAQSEDVPFIPEMPEDVKDVAAISGKTLNTVLSVSFMSEKDDSARISLTGVLLMFDGETMYSMAASNGRGAYTWYSSKASGKGKFLIPVSTVELLQQYTYDGDVVNIYFDGKKLWFRTSNYLMHTVLINAEFPYQHITTMVNQEKPYHVTVSRSDLSEALNTCFNLVRVTMNKTKRITFNCDTKYNLLTVSTDKSNEIGEMEWPLVITKHNKQGFEFSLSTDYLHNIISALEKLATSDLMAELSGGDNITISLGYNEEAKVHAPIYVTSPEMQALFMLAPLGVPKLL